MRYDKIVTMIKQTIQIDYGLFDKNVAKRFSP